MNGFGYYKHFSGYIYEGVFVNGHPVNAPSKLTITIEEIHPTQNEKFKVTEGKMFKLAVKSRNDHGELFQGLLFFCYLKYGFLFRINFVNFSEDGRYIQIKLAVKLDINDKDPYENKHVTEL